MKYSIINVLAAFGLFVAVLSCDSIVKEVDGKVSSNVKQMENDNDNFVSIPSNVKQAEDGNDDSVNIPSNANNTLQTSNKVVKDRLPDILDDNSNPPQGYDAWGGSAKCVVVDPNLGIRMCKRNPRPEDALKEICESEGGEITNCGCNAFICSKKINVMSQEATSNDSQENEEKEFSGIIDELIYDKGSEEIVLQLLFGGCSNDHEFKLKLESSLERYPPIDQYKLIHSKGYDQTCEMAIGGEFRIPYKSSPDYPHSMSIIGHNGEVIIGELPPVKPQKSFYQIKEDSNTPPQGYDAWGDPAKCIDRKPVCPKRLSRKEDSLQEICQERRATVIDCGCAEYLCSQSVNIMN